MEICDNVRNLVLRIIERSCFLFIGRTLYNSGEEPGSLQDTAREVSYLQPAQFPAHITSHLNIYINVEKTVDIYVAFRLSYAVAAASRYPVIILEMMMSRFCSSRSRRNNLEDSISLSIMPTQHHRYSEGYHRITTLLTSRSLI